MKPYYILEAILNGETLKRECHELSCFDVAHFHNHSNSIFFFKFTQDDIHFYRENLMVILMLGTSSTKCRGFPRPDLWLNIGPFPIKK